MNVTTLLVAVAGASAFLGLTPWLHARLLTCSTLSSFVSIRTSLRVKTLATRDAAGYGTLLHLHARPRRPRSDSEGR